jgi:hypothetical protein
MKVPIDDCACINLDAPVLPAYEAFVSGSVYWLVWCEHCGTYHRHGPAEGHREAHCVRIWRLPGHGWDVESPTATVPADTGRRSFEGATATMTEYHRIWIEQCEAAEQIEGEFGTQKALDYLVGDKFLNFLEAAESDSDFLAEISAFVAKIREIFEQWQLAQYLETARETEPFDGDHETDPEEIEDMRRDDIRQCTRDLLLVERAREWLLEDDQVGRGT